jgi:N-methylhydantoinase B
MEQKTDPIQLEVFKHRFAAIAEEMGAVLQKASYSPNIKERRDFSCAVFNQYGRMIAQAAHIPVHLGSMPLSVNAAILKFTGALNPGDMIILNDPFQGGTHLPDITLVSPVFIDLPGGSVALELVGFVASRAHHSDVGGMTPGSMPVAKEIFQEGVIIPPIKILESGNLNQDIYRFLLANVRTPEERAGDLQAQIAANQRGESRLKTLAAGFGVDIVHHYMDELLLYTERLVRNLLSRIQDGDYSYEDFLDNDGLTDEPVLIKATISIHNDTARVDFTGSSAQRAGSINAVYAITLSAIYYVFRCLLSVDVPNNDGCLNPIEVIAPQGTVVNALHPAAVAGGNVETSQRIVDVLLGALSQALPDQIPAASQGTMNNISIGGSVAGRSFAYYETIGGGMGALLGKDGPSGVHSHMTNTLNTPVEALEYAYPLRILQYKLREGTGGEGKFQGGEGIRRDILFLTEAQATLLTERRIINPYGLQGGGKGSCGENFIIRDGREIKIAGKGTFDLKTGDILSIRTPGGGGFGSSAQQE